MPDFDEKVKAAFDAEFERTRPRPGLRGRVIANAVATPRTQRGLRTWLTPPRLATLAAAAVLVLVVGVGVRIATQAPPIARVSPSPSAAQLAFGKLPPPALHPLMGFGGGGGGQVAAVPYFGPATMTWAGQLPSVPASAPVHRFTLPTTADADALAARLGGKLISAGSALEPRSYQLAGGFVLSVQMNDPVAGEPTYIINTGAEAGRNLPYTEDQARKVADAELAKRGLTPTWPSKVQLSKLQGSPAGPVLFVVMYQRVIPLSGGLQALEVDGNGNQSGIEVTVDSEGHLSRIAGIIRLSEQTATYPLRAPSTVVNAAVAATPAQSGGSGAAPAVTLNHVTLVYTTVTVNAVGYLEPAYYFTGTFDRDGYLQEKRVLIPALAASALAS
jgi:hypothetical protein